MITNVEAVTVFNGRLDRGTKRKVYIPTVIRGVSCVEAKGATVTNNGVWSDNVQYKIRVPLNAGIQDGRSYLPCQRYAKLDDSEAVRHWTISKEDVIIRGEYTGELSLLYEDDVARYAQGQGADQIRIIEYADDTEGGSPYMRHWRIGGK